MSVTRIHADKTSYVTTHMAATSVSVLCTDTTGKWTTTASPSVRVSAIFLGLGIPIIKIRRSDDRLIFIMEIHILVISVYIYTETILGCISV